MPSGPLSHFIHNFRRQAALRDVGEVADGDLLRRFARGRDEDAFAALVHRHGPLVLGVCRRVLHDPNDADDAFQATFLVLARKAGSIADPGRLANWLYGVANRVAQKARVSSARERARRQPVTDLPARESGQSADWEEVRRILDDEVQRLPHRFRAPLVLCYLQGQTREQAAERLGWSAGAVKGMLERGREVLRTRLVRRGIGLSAGSLAAMLSGNALSAAVPAALADTTVKAALGFAVASAVAGHAAALAEGVLQAMWMTRMKTALAAVLVLGLVGTGAGVLAFGGRPAEPETPRQSEPPQKAEEKADQLQRLATGRLDAAKSAFELCWARYQVGVEREDMVTLWSRRWLQAQLDQATKKDDRDAALAAHQERLKKVDVIARARLDLGITSKLPGTLDEEQERYESAWQELQDNFKASAETVCRASVRLLMVRSAGSKIVKTIDPKAELKEHLDRITKVEKLLKPREEAGAVTQLEVDTATYYRLEAEAWLAQGRVFGEKDLWPDLRGNEKE
jgi:RNA polymerase sigma factor (sigma-70 family)